MSDNTVITSYDESMVDQDTVRTIWDLFLRRFKRHKPAIVSLIVLFVLAAICYSAPLYIEEDAVHRIDVKMMRKPPSAEHPLGTDDVGRDMLLRIIFGGIISLRIGVLAALIGVTIGVTIGTIAGYYSGWVDNVLMRIAEALLSIPQLFILIVLSRILGSSVLVITAVIGVLSWMRISRLVRANVLSLRERDYVTAARAQGAPVSRILMRHIVPNTLAPIVVAGTLQVGRAIVLEASLSFLGMGVQPPTATWGSMLNRAQAYLTTAPWIAIAPGVMILVVVLCVNFLGDGLRDALDPQSYR
jgi:peptide/nickel transport system permease protein